MDYQANIKTYLKRLKEIIDKLDIRELDVAMNAIGRAYEEQGNVYIFGNGGSAATASHFVCDFNKGVSEGKSKKFNFICLNDNVPIMMAISNDKSYDDIFSFQLEQKLKTNDLIVAISGSGNSTNVIKAVRYAKQCGIPVVGITGYDGGELKQLSDYSMHVPVNDMQVVEDLHMVFDHMMMKIFCERFE